MPSYAAFEDYGDAEGYRKRIEQIRNPKQDEG